MDIKLLILSIIFVFIGIITMINNKFYKYESSDMLFATKLKVFLSGLLFSLIGLYGIVSQFFNI
jgi:hypothetical protein